VPPRVGASGETRGSFLRGLGVTREERTRGAGLTASGLRAFCPG
jgi:hypothetical protein